MKSKTRQTIGFAPPQAERLAVEAERLGISVSELMRRIVDRYFEREAIPQPQGVPK